MKASARLTLTYNDAARAKTVASAVSLDDEGYVKTVRKGRMVTAEASAGGPMGLLHTLDDYLACVSVAERTAAQARPPGRGRRGRV